MLWGSGQESGTLTCLAWWQRALQGDPMVGQGKQVLTGGLRPSEAEDRPSSLGPWSGEESET